MDAALCPKRPDGYRAALQFNERASQFFEGCKKQLPASALMDSPRSGFRRAAATSWALAGIGIAGVGGASVLAYGDTVKPVSADALTDVVELAPGDSWAPTPPNVPPVPDVVTTTVDPPPPPVTTAPPVPQVTPETTAAQAPVATYTPGRSTPLRPPSSKRRPVTRRRRCRRSRLPERLTATHPDDGDGSELLPSHHQVQRFMTVAAEQIAHTVASTQPRMAAVEHEHADRRHRSRLPRPWPAGRSTPNSTSSNAAASRFRPDSEINALAASAGRPTQVSEVLADLLIAALSAARLTDGDVDPTSAPP